MKLDGIKKLYGKIREKFQLFENISRSRSVDLLEGELAELENVFALITLGSLIGLTSPPSHITINLLPDSENELILLLNKVDSAASPLSMLASRLRID